MKTQELLSQNRQSTTCAPPQKTPAELRRADEDWAVREAGSCLSGSFCDSCDLCRYFCPDLCVSRNPETGLIEVDYDFCKGCGLCAFICPKGAITMFDENSR